MKYGYSDNKEAIAKRLNRVEGQVRGVARMVNEDKYCIDILTQISAAQAALDKVALELLREHTKHCIANAATKDEQNHKADELVGAINRMLTR
jgi:CsoR family transcriptional regulator, copper-sensing transcriptional repressor